MLGLLILWDHHGVVDIQNAAPKWGYRVIINMTFVFYSRQGLAGYFGYASLPQIETIR